MKRSNKLLLAFGAFSLFCMLNGCAHSAVQETSGTAVMQESAGGEEPEISGEAEGDSSDQETEILYQAALLQSLTLGDYEGSITAGELKALGDTGIGTFHQVNGEMIMLDGVVYQALADGTVVVADDQATIPFGNVTRFEEDGRIELSDLDNLDQLRVSLDQIVQQQGGNNFYMVKITGTFKEIQVRSEYAQEPPYRPLNEVMETDQVIFDYRNLEGTVVGLYCPGYMNGLNTPGWHFHFLSQDASQGGHVLGLSMEKGTAAYDLTPFFQLMLPQTETFQSLDLSVDLSEEIDQVENN